MADASDAMTSARAYRPGRAFSDALRELWRCAGTQFDGEIVQALAKAVPAIDPGHARAPLRDAADIGELPRLAGAARN